MSSLRGQCERLLRLAQTRTEPSCTRRWQTSQRDPSPFLQLPPGVWKPAYSGGVASARSALLAGTHSPFDARDEPDSPSQAHQAHRDEARGRSPTCSNLLNQEFTAELPNQKWVSDTTFVWTAEGWLYIAVILDLFSRLMVGWAMGPHNDEALVHTASERPCFYNRVRQHSTLNYLSPVQYEQLMK